MHGGAITLARRFLAHSWQPDVLMATDMLDLTTFLALTRVRNAGIPTILYCHENQLTYPTPRPGKDGPWRRQLGQRDQHYAFINYASALAADQVWFNSHYHHDAFLAALPDFLKHFPEANELASVGTIHDKSRVLPVGIDLARLQPPAAPRSAAEPPLILWNQRWEYDKNPADFFAALYGVVDAGIPFRLALCGENFRRRPAEFDEARSRLAPRIIHFGYAKSDDYRRLLWQADVTISTAHHEFFGISILEAIYCHTFPLLPRRLSYPELLPPTAHEACLYDTQAQLVEKLTWALTHLDDVRGMAGENAGSAAHYDWRHVAPTYDAALLDLTQASSKTVPTIG